MNLFAYLSSAGHRLSLQNVFQYFMRRRSGRRWDDAPTHWHTQDAEKLMKMPYQIENNQGAGGWTEMATHEPREMGRCGARERERRKCSWPNMRKYCGLKRATTRQKPVKAEIKRSNQMIKMVRRCRWWWRWCRWWRWWRCCCCWRRRNLRLKKKEAEAKREEGETQTSNLKTWCRSNIFFPCRLPVNAC